jgi:5-carboxymethyl-2-hydroxymuconic-semialdehyde dehydrogenase
MANYNIQHFINGEFVDSLDGRTFETLNPATNYPIGTVADGQSSDRAVKAARAAFDSGVWSKMPAAARSQRLRRIADLIEKQVDDIAEREIVDVGIPISQVKGGAIPRAAYNFNYFAEMTHRVTGESYPMGDQFLNYSLRRPVGVAGLITPWNTPFMLSTWKAAPALTFGNTVVLKPAEWSPLTADSLAHIIQEADLPPGVFNVVHGFGETAGAPLVAHPAVQVISFTGETTTGMEIIRNGSSTLKRYSMELGGKSPTLIFEDAEFDRAIDGAIFQVYSLNGERCTAGSRLLVQNTIHDEVVARLTERVAHIKTGDPRDPATEVGPLIHPDHWARVRAYMDIAREEGASIAVGGDRPAGLSEGNYFAPTLITGVRNEMRIAQEEVFGPVLTVIAFTDEADAIRIANGVKYGLAAYVWTQNGAKAQRVAHAIEAGMVWINSHNVRDLRTPFGGSKYSGIGREGDHHSLELYTEQKAVHMALGEHHIPRMGAE